MCPVRRMLAGLLFLFCNVCGVGGWRSVEKEGSDHLDIVRESVCLLGEGTGYGISTFIKLHPTNGIPDPTDRNHQALHYRKHTKNTHIRPPRHSTHLITNPDNTRHLILRTQIPPNLQITIYIFTARNTTHSDHCIILLSSWWWAYWCPKHVEQAIRSAIKTSVACSWHFISTHYCTLKEFLMLSVVCFVSKQI